MEEKEPTLLEKSQLLVIRHAYSEFNHAWNVYIDEDKSHEAFMNVWAGEHLLDAHLHSDGVVQAKQQQSLINYFTFRKIYVSPHRRTI